MVSKSSYFHQRKFNALPVDLSPVLVAMVTGQGVRGGRGRCFTLWRDFMTCAAQRGSYGPGVCQEQREDYMECLHRSKLVIIIQLHMA